jgi:SulP family sulfate permease
LSYLSELLPSRADYAQARSVWRHDVMAGVTVGIVALPLALAFGITTGAGARAGLITAIYAGLIAAVFGGSHYQVSGPTGAMTVVLVPIVIKYGVASLAPLGLLAGLLVVAMGFTHLGGLIKRVPWPVMEGFTLGIALVIAMQQLPSVLSSKSVSGPNTLITAWRTIHRSISSGLHWSSLALMVLTLAVKFTYPKIAHRLKIRIHIPASFIAIIAATLVVQLFSLKVPQIGNLPRSLFAHVSLTSSHIGIAALAIGAIQIALLAAIESLLSARVADQMIHVHEGSFSYKPNRELVGQGLATMVSSLVGGMPATGAIARTSVNVRSKAQSRISSITHALFLILVVLVLNPVIAHIPTAALGAVLIGTSYRIASPANLKELLRTTRLDSLTLLITAALVVVIGLIWAIALCTAGYFLATIVLAQRQKRAVAKGS